MKKLLPLIVLLVIAFVMMLTRPDKDAHKAEIMKAVNELLDKVAQQRGFGDGELAPIGKQSLGQIIEVAVDTKLQYDDYYLFTVTHAEIGNQDRTLSVGLCDHVFTFGDVIN